MSLRVPALVPRGLRAGVVVVVVGIALYRGVETGGGGCIILPRADHDITIRACKGAPSAFFFLPFSVSPAFCVAVG